jgi:hypothetical protein
MVFEGINFPVYRKYLNGKSYFKIISRNEFEEVQIIGAKKAVNSIIVTQLPEMNLIHDLVYDSSVAYEITEDQYNSAKESN